MSICLYVFTHIPISHLAGDKNSDCVICIQNDHLQSICRERMQLKTVMFVDLNRLIAQQLAALLIPSTGGSGSGSGCQSIQEMIIHLCPHPLMKLVYPKFVPLVSI